MKYSFISVSCPDLTLDALLETAKRFGYGGIEPRIQANHAHLRERLNMLEKTLDYPVLPRVQARRRGRSPTALSLRRLIPSPFSSGIRRGQWRR